MSYDDLSSRFAYIAEAAIDAELVGYDFLRVVVTDGGTRPSGYEAFSDGFTQFSRGGDAITGTAVVSRNGASFVPQEVFGRWEQAIPELFSPLLSAPDPVQYGETISELSSLTTRLRNEGHGAAVRAAISDFAGGSADAFRDYLALLDETSDNLALVVEVLQTELAALAAMWDGFRLGVEQLVEGTHQAFVDVVDSAVSPALTFKSLSWTLSALTKFAPAPAKPRLRVIAIASKLGQIVSDHYDPEPQQFSLSGGSATEVWANVNDTVRHLRYDLVDAERETVQNQLIDVLALMRHEDDDPRPSFRVPPTHALGRADGPDAVVGAHADLQALRPQLHSAVEQLRDDLAPLYDAAALAVDPYRVRSAFIRGGDLAPPLPTDGAYPFYEDACRYVQDALRASSESLAEAAGVLKAISDHFDETDAAITEAMRAATRKVHDRFHSGSSADDRRTPLG